MREKEEAEKTTRRSSQSSQWVKRVTTAPRMEETRFVVGKP
jgi:hypothetical protein